MGMKKNNLINNYDILCSIWILACNDDNPQITYQGIFYRLGLPEDFPLQDLIAFRGELFRKQTTNSLLEAWKEEMRIGKKIPSWIRDSDKTNEIKKELIEKLTIQDVFRSQFRTGAESARSEIEIIDWGLQHIERLRNFDLDSKKEATRIFTSIVVPILSTVVAIIAVVSSFYVQYQSNKSQIFLKHYEVELKPKQEGYTNFMKSLSKSFYYAHEMNKGSMEHEFDNIENSFYSIEPFLSSTERLGIWNKYQQFAQLCYAVIETDSLRAHPDRSADSLIVYKDFFRDHLYGNLFLKSYQK